MKTLKLISISDIKTEKSRKDGKVSREYFTAEFSDSSNPFAIKTIKRNFFQLHSADGKSATWGALNYDAVKALVGKTVPGEVVNEVVEAYEIEGRSVNNYTTVLLPGENKQSIFRQLGHPLAVASAPEMATEEDTLN